MQGWMDKETALHLIHDMTLTFHCISCEILQMYTVVFLHFLIPTLFLYMCYKFMPTCNNFNGNCFSASWGLSHSDFFFDLPVKV